MAALNILAWIISLTFLIHAADGRSPPRFRTTTDWKYHTFSSAGSTVHCWWPSSTMSYHGQRMTRPWHRYSTQSTYHWWLNSLSSSSSTPSSWYRWGSSSSTPSSWYSWGSSSSTPSSWYRWGSSSSTPSSWYRWGSSSSTPSSWYRWGSSSSTPSSWYRWGSSSSTPSSWYRWGSSSSTPSSWSMDGMICFDEEEIPTATHFEPYQADVEKYGLAEMIKRHALLAGSIIGGVTLFIIGTVLTAVYCCTKKATQTKVDFKPKPVYMVPDTELPVNAEKFDFEAEPPMPPQNVTGIHPPPTYTA